MKRRSFIRLIGLGIAGATLTSTLSSCSAGDEKLDYGWNGPNESESDIRLKVLAYAILAPNPHNIQPWLIKFNEQYSLDLFLHPDFLSARLWQQVGFQSHGCCTPPAGSS